MKQKRELWGISKAVNVRTVEKEENVNRHHQTITWLTLMWISGKRALILQFSIFRVQAYFLDYCKVPFLQLRFCSYFAKTHLEEYRDSSETQNCKNRLCSFWIHEKVPFPVIVIQVLYSLVREHLIQVTDTMEWTPLSLDVMCFQHLDDANGTGEVDSEIYGGRGTGLCTFRYFDVNAKSRNMSRLL